MPTEWPWRSAHAPHGQLVCAVCGKQIEADAIYWHSSPAAGRVHDECHKGLQKFGLDPYDDDFLSYEAKLDVADAIELVYTTHQNFPQKVEISAPDKVVDALRLIQVYSAYLRALVKEQEH